MLKKYRGMEEITSVRSAGLEPGDSPQALYCLIRTPCRSELQLDVRAIETEVIDRAMLYPPTPPDFRDLVFALQHETPAK
jgi:hypothetical protein